MNSDQKKGGPQKKLTGDHPIFTIDPFIPTCEFCGKEGIGKESPDYDPEHRRGSSIILEVSEWNPRTNLSRPVLGGDPPTCSACKPELRFNLWTEKWIQVDVWSGKFNVPYKWFPNYLLPDERVLSVWTHKKSKGWKTEFAWFLESGQVEEARILILSDLLVQEAKIQNNKGNRTSFSTEEVKRVREIMKTRANEGYVSSIIQWMIIDIATSTGITTSEMFLLQCGDFNLVERRLQVKGSRPRVIDVPESMLTHYIEFIKWRRSRGHELTPSAPLLIGQRGPLSAQGITQAVRSALSRAGVKGSGKRMGCLRGIRRSYAEMLFKNTKDLRLVQHNLGHRTMQSTLSMAYPQKSNVVEWDDH